MEWQESDSSDLESQILDNHLERDSEAVRISVELEVVISSKDLLIDGLSSKLIGRFLSSIKV